MSGTWLAVIGVLVGAAVGAAAAIWGSWTATRHEDRRAATADLRSRREEWFRRVQWAEGLANDPSKWRSTAGLRILEALVRSDLATTDEVSIIEALIEPRMNELIVPLQQDDLAIDEFVRHNEEQVEEGGPR